MLVHLTDKEARRLLQALAFAKHNSGIDTFRQECDKLTDKILVTEFWDRNFPKELRG